MLELELHSFPEVVYTTLHSFFFFKHDRYLELEINFLEAPRSKDESEQIFLSLLLKS